MGKFIINHEVSGYKTVDINNSELLDSDNNEIVLVLDESTNGKLNEYYNKVLDILLSKNKLYVIVVAKESKIRQSICILVANYRNYNLYKVDSKDTITQEYVDTILERKPTIDEVESFIGGDISGYADLNVLLIGIENLVSSGDMDGLKNFIEGHIHSVESMSSIAEYMKKIVDTTNSGELMARINELRAEIRGINDKLDEADKENRQVKDENLRLVESNEASKKELAKLMSKNRELEEQVSSAGPVIQTYSPINTQIFTCKVLNIIYFKEISYVQYTNSAVLTLFNILKIMKKKVKLIIYDSRAGLSTVYKPMSVIGGSEFVANKDNFVTHVEKFVVVEPNPVILTSILESTNPVFDVVIVYDRMRQPINIVEGNNITNFWVINSNKDFNEVKSQLSIKDKSNIITRVGSSIGEETLNIPTIQGYNLPGVTDSAKISKYQKLQTAGTNKSIIQTILDKARITKG